MGQGQHTTLPTNGAVNGYDEKGMGAPSVSYDQTQGQGQGLGGGGAGGGGRGGMQAKKATGRSR